MFNVQIIINGIYETEIYRQKLTITYKQPLSRYIIAWLYHNIWEEIVVNGKDDNHQEKCILLHIKYIMEYREVYGEMEFFCEDRR